MDGQREINELHVPLGRPVKLIMGSEDVLHSYFIPAFRVKADVIPGRYNMLWFTASKPGRYHLFCAEYCGTNHSGMIGSIIVMEPAEFQAWLGGRHVLGHAGGRRGKAVPEPGVRRLPSSGRHDSRRRCSRTSSASTVPLQGGATVVADEAYIRESIVNPQAKIVAGFQPLMPTFQGLVSEEQLLQLIAYIKSLSTPGGAPAGAGAGEIDRQCVARGTGFAAERTLWKP